jgi:bifunctional non-homologous end joining protein LigD
MDDEGRSDFNLLQNFRSAQGQIHYFAFDCLMHIGVSLLDRALAERRKILAKILPRNEHVSLSVVGTSLTDMLKFVRDHGLEGVIAKSADSLYEPGKRSGLWSKHRINMGQEFVVGGYTRGGNGFDALVLGFYRGKDLHFASRVRAGFVPATRRQVFDAIKALKIDKCPFVNLPEKTAGRWGQGLTAEKMKQCVWVKPQVVVRIDFLEWTDGDKLRHTKYAGLREDKNPRKVVRET